MAGGAIPRVASCDPMRPHADWRASHFVSRSRAKPDLFPKNTGVASNPTRGAFFAGCRAGSHGAAPTPLPVSLRFGSGGALAAGFGLPHEPHARRHDRKAVEMGAEQAAKIGAIEG
jgi:hypothetical protein